MHCGASREQGHEIESTPGQSDETHLVLRPASAAAPGWQERSDLAQSPPDAEQEPALLVLAMS